MIKLFLLIPLLSFGLWYLFLKQNGWSSDQGRKGFIVISIFNVVILSFFGFLLWVTN